MNFGATGALMALVGRKKEQETLLRALKSDKSEFIAVYGRRRIGKTFLVRETYRQRIVFQHTGVYKGGVKRQLGAFCKSLAEAGAGNFDLPANWMDAFELLKDVLGQDDEVKKVIFLDELSWMDTPKSDLLAALEWFWNGWASARHDIVLVVCASATSWMLNKVIHNKGGLYNRLSRRINLGQFTLEECEELLRSRGVVMNRYQILELYMVLGGIPYYWEFVERGKSSAQNIDSMLFAEGAPLADEFDYLFDAIFARPEGYLKIIEALTGKKAGLTRKEIAQRAKVIDSGHLSEKLEELESCGFIRAYRSYGKRNKGTLYQLMDNFTLFYYKFLKEKPTDEHFWTSQQGGSSINAWRGLAFERVCLEHLPQIKGALGISGVNAEVNSWFCAEDPEHGVKGSQIDLLIARKDQVINICEMKYSQEPFVVTKTVDDAISRKLADFRAVTGTTAALHPTLVTTYDIAQNQYASSFQSVVTAADLFAM